MIQTKQSPTPDNVDSTFREFGKPTWLNILIQYLEEYNVISLCNVFIGCTISLHWHSKVSGGAINYIRNFVSLAF